MRSLVALCLLLPFMEAGLLIVLASYVGFTPMMLEVLVSGLAGSWLLSRSGRSGLLQANQRLRSNDAPVEQILGDMLRAAAGLMLLLPGVATDLVGLAMALPRLRAAMARQWSGQADLFRYDLRGAAPDSRRPGQAGSGTAPAGPQVRRAPDGRDVIEGEFRRED